MYQKIFSNHGNKPFVAFIVGPYSPKLNSTKVISEFKCFYVMEDQENPHPYELEIKVVPQKNVNSRVVNDILGIFSQSCAAIDKVNLTEKWKGKMKRYEKLRR